MIHFYQLGSTHNNWCFLWLVLNFTFLVVVRACLQTAMDKQISDKFKELSLRMLQMQEQIREFLIEARQTRQMQQDLTIWLAALGPRSDAIPIRHITNLLFLSPTMINVHIIFTLLLKWKLHISLALNSWLDFLKKKKKTKFQFLSYFKKTTIGHRIFSHGWLNFRLAVKDS